MKGYEVGDLLKGKHTSNIYTIVSIEPCRIAASCEDANRNECPKQYYVCLIVKLGPRMGKVVNLFQKIGVVDCVLTKVENME